MTQATSPHKVLVVEDDPGVREAIAEVLEDSGYAPVGASNGQEALDRLYASPDKPCMILLDIMMPVMDGREFRLAQQADPALADIPVVVLSAHANVAEAAHAMQANDALRKPLQLDVLMAIVRRFCQPVEATA